MTSGIIACQAPLSTEFSKQEYWSGLPFPTPLRVSNEGLNFLCSRVATGISWSSLGGLKRVKPPEAFGERSRDWSLGHAGDEGPHLAILGESEAPGVLLSLTFHLLPVGAQEPHYQRLNCAACRVYCCHRHCPVLPFLRRFWNQAYNWDEHLLPEGRSLGAK